MKRDNVKPIRPRTEDWNSLSTQKKNQEAAVDIIIPVYGAPDDTLRCIYSVLKTKNQTHLIWLLLKMQALCQNFELY